MKLIVSRENFRMMISIFTLAVIQKILKGEIEEERRRVKRETKLICCSHCSSLLLSLKIRQDLLLSCSIDIRQAELVQCIPTPSISWKQYEILVKVI